MVWVGKLTAQRLSEPIEDIYADITDRLVENIAKHLREGDAKRTADWEVRKLQELGMLTKENAKIINEALKDIPDEIRNALEETRAIALKDIEERVAKAIAEGKIQEAPTDGTKAVIQAFIDQAQDKYNLVNTTMLNSSVQAYVQSVNEASTAYKATMEQKQTAQDILNESAASFSSGAETREQVMKKTISKMAENGIFAFTDKAGRRWTPEAYVSMDMRTTCHNTAIKAIQTRQQDYGSDIFMVSTHPGARPLCYPYQGKYFTWGSVGGTFTDGAGNEHRYEPISSTSYGQPAGLFGINCGHYPMVQIPGVTIPHREDKQSRAENDKEYLQSQQQRALERQVRAYKRKAEAFKQAGLEEAYKEAKQKVGQANKLYKEFIKQTGRTARNDRLKVYGFDGTKTRYGNDDTRTKKGTPPNKPTPAGIAEHTAAETRKRAVEKARSMENTEAVNQIKEEMYKTKAFKKEDVIHMTPSLIDIGRLTFDNNHINVERKHEVTEEQAKQYIKDAYFSVTVWGGLFERYYSENGAAYVNVEKQEIRTSYSRKQYGNRTKKLMEAYKNGISKL
nr:MAG TPA: minor capsid protein [Caudoviricetes sp.]